MTLKPGLVGANLENTQLMANSIRVDMPKHAIEDAKQCYQFYYMQP